MDDLHELHRLVIFYLKEQNRILEKKTGETYITDEDVKDISTWEIFFIRDFLRRLRITEKYSDIIICPWCCRYFPSCDLCSYKSRHGSCDGDNHLNTYGMISNTLYENNEIGEGDNEGIHSLKEIISIISHLKESYESFLYVKKLKTILK